MKRNDPSLRISSILFLLVVTLSMLMVLASCGGGEKAAEEPESFEVALITDNIDNNDNPFMSSTWEAINSFCDENNNDLTCQWKAASTTPDMDDKELVEACRKAVEEAKAEGGKVMVFAGSQFETVVHSLQGEYEDLYFILIDGVPRDDDFNYEMAANSTGVLFAEEEAGFLAGYAAVADGYNRLAFMGGQDLPPVKRYGYGYIQGAAAAAKDAGRSDVEVKYTYTDTFKAADWISKGASRWYGDGTQVIFACGGSIVNSVIKAAEDTGSEEDGENVVYSGKVIGVDTDQSGRSDTVITSAKKEIQTSVNDILNTYIHDNFKGNSIFNYDLKNKGVSIEIKNSRFKDFKGTDYTTLVDDIKAGKISIRKEMGDKDLKDLAPDGIKVTKEKLNKD